ncbi:MFS transporter [Microbacterium sp. cx-55]|uniref:MFS transporter n=1 Tax=Microbacterium sp. cx-55 TaxID=2875948 RepID=UPI001CBF7230|nr:MFS transporter [Microbacterium sp. cx-55]MBZ4488620.1 MFS transporter [Microbacterium sp. cx-55]UGB36197.1 MFS transporter [Microbacterium sp. cx-55]
MSISPSPVRGISAYRVLPQRVGWSYLLATALGRLPMSMVPLAILTLATSATGSIAIGGFAAAAAALGEAVGAPASGALADLRGQRGVLLTATVLHVSFLIAFTFGAGVVPDAVTIALAGAAGLTLPQVGALSRARWLAIAPADLDAAFAFEGVIDEMVYIFGPALVGLVAAFISPQAATLLAAALIALFATQFAVHRTHRQVPLRPRRTSTPVPRRPGSGRRRALVAVTFLGMVSMGVFFGGSQTGLAAFAQSAGIPDAGALLYAVMAVGSAVTTVSMVLLPGRIGRWTRWTTAAAGMTLGATCMLLAPSVPWVIGAALLAGAFQGPLLLTIFGVAGSLAEDGRAGALMTLTASGVVVGIGIGAAVAGQLAQASGPSGAFGTVLSASLVLCALGLSGAVLSRRRRGGLAPEAP